MIFLLNGEQRGFSLMNYTPLTQFYDFRKSFGKIIKIQKRSTKTLLT